MDEASLPAIESIEYPEAEPFPERQRQQSGQAAPEQSEDLIQEVEEEEESPEGAGAPLPRKKRTRKPLAPDRSIELRTQELNSWQRNYLANMDEARKRKIHLKMAAQAKYNANWMLWGVGLGGIGAEIGHLGIRNAMETFYGESLRGMVMSLHSYNVGQKHERQRSQSEDVDEQRGDEARRKRQRSGSADAIPRGVEVAAIEDDALTGAEHVEHEVSCPGYDEANPRNLN